MQCTRQSSQSTAMRRFARPAMPPAESCKEGGTSSLHFFDGCGTIIVPERHCFAVHAPFRGSSLAVPAFCSRRRWRRRCGSRRRRMTDCRLRTKVCRLSMTDRRPLWTLDGHLRMTLPFAASALRTSALRPQTMPASCAFRCAHVHRRASFVSDPVRPSPGVRRVCRCARRTAWGNKSIRDCEN